VHRALPGKWAEEEANPAPELDDIVEKKVPGGACIEIRRQGVGQLVISAALSRRYGKSRPVASHGGSGRWRHSDLVEKTQRRQPVRGLLSGQAGTAQRDTEF